ncbi:MAG: ATPase, T2SS/T4P/T4SS family, partial [Planctomycetota bacterium]
CKVPYSPEDEEAKLVGFEEGKGGKIYKKGGCTKCGGSGYKGRTGIHELMVVNDEIRDIINKRGSAEDVRDAAIRNGMISLHKDSMEKVRDGISSMEEALRTVRPDE